MRLSRYLLATLRSDPREAESPSHRLLLRAGMIRQIAAGIYDLLPTGLRCIRKVESILREEMNRAGALEVQLPLVQPADLWKESKRLDLYGKELLRFEDRNHRSFVLGPTHEEVITDLVRREVSSYRQLPLILYQIHTKFRDEPRPRFGLMRAREFAMKDAYSFHATPESMSEGYERMRETYIRIFSRCGLEFRVVEADTGAIGGSKSHEFVVLAKTGEAEIVHCPQCNYAANRELSPYIRGDSTPSSPPSPPPPEKVYTPGKKTIAEVSEFLKIPPEGFLKMIVMETSRGPYLVGVRGDLEVSEVKFRNAIQAEWAVILPEDEVAKLGLVPGFIGPIKQATSLPFVCDLSVSHLPEVVTGANEKDYHILHMKPRRDFHPQTFYDIALVPEGSPCPSCSQGQLRLEKGIEVGHIFQLGVKYSQAMNATYLDEQGQRQPFWMGCYGIGVGRTLAAAIEQGFDEKGIVFPPALSPFLLAIVPLDPTDPELNREAERIYYALFHEGFDVVLDDRDERAGVKLTDLELVGVPFRIVLGKRSLARGMAEWQERKGGKMEEIPLPQVIDTARERLKNILGSQRFLLS